YLCHARLRDFRGSTLYTVPSFFLEELGERAEDSLERIDLSADVGTAQSIDQWRSGGPAAMPGWSDAGISPRWGKPSTPAFSSGSPTTNIQHYEPGMHVRHETYGDGRVTEVGGYGALRKVKIRFAKAGERTFLAEKARLEIVGH